MHLMTSEALALYLRKLAPGGMLAFHISNIHLTACAYLRRTGPRCRDWCASATMTPT